MINFNAMAALETPEFMTARLDKFGGPESYNHYAVGWAWAMDTPFQWTKQVASHWGGTRNGTIVHWPGGIEAKGELRSQFCHVIDLAPTVLEVAGIPEPTMVNGVTQSPYEGTSMRYSFDDADAAERHDLQYFEMFANRGIYHQGWSAVTKHRTPWEMGAVKLPRSTTTSGSCTTATVTTARPTTWPRSIRTGCTAAAVADRGGQVQRHPPGRPHRRARSTPTSPAGPAHPGRHPGLLPGMTRLSENSVLNIKNRSFSVTAEVVSNDGPLNGTILAQGGAIGGWSLYTSDGHAKFACNLLGIQTFTTEASQPIPAGTHQVRMEFAYDGGGYAKAAPSPSTTTARRSARAASGRPSRSSSRPTRAPTSAAKPAPPWRRPRRGDQRLHRPDQLGRAQDRRRRPHPARPGGPHPRAHGPPMAAATTTAGSQGPTSAILSNLRTPKWSEMNRPLCRNLRTSMLDRIGIARCSALRST